MQRNLPGPLAAVHRLALPGVRRPVLALNAAGPFGRLMHRHGWRGFTLPLPLVTLVLFWLRPGQRPDPRVVVHEAAHCVQIEQEGVVRFVCGYLWQQFRRGYADNRYEVAARRAEALSTLDGDDLRRHLSAEAKAHHSTQGVSCVR